MEYLVKVQDYLKLKIKDTYRLAHSYRVANIGKEIAEKEGLNVEDLMIACLLHDVSYCTPFKTQDEWQNHGRVSGKMVRIFLESIDYPKERIHDICYAIAIHVDLKADFDGEYASYECTTKTAQTLWLDRIQFQMNYFERLKDQLKISTAL